MAAVLLCRIYLDFAVENKYNRDKVLERMHVLDVPLKAKVYRRAEKLPPSPGKPSTLAQIQKRGFLYVGYSEDGLPFTFFNQAGELVGYDVDMAYELQQDMGIDIIFIPYRYDRLVEMIRKGRIDMDMGGLAMTPSRFDRISLTDPSLERTYSSVVPGYRKQEFADIDEIRRRDDLTIAVLDDEYLVKRIKENFPKAAIEPIRSYMQFFEGNIGTWDALAISAEADSAWSLLYPKYGVVVPKPRISTYPVGYGVAMGNQNLLVYLNNWLTIMKNSNRTREAYDRWILGKGAEEKKTRWCVIRNVLHWVN